MCSFRVLILLFSSMFTFFYSFSCVDVNISCYDPIILLSYSFSFLIILLSNILCSVHHVGVDHITLTSYSFSFIWMDHIILFSSHSFLHNMVVAIMVLLLIILFLHSSFIDTISFYSLLWCRHDPIILLSYSFFFFLLFYSFTLCVFLGGYIFPPSPPPPQYLID